MKILLFITFCLINLMANQGVKSETCKSCHPTIYSEFYGSSHRKSSIYEDPIHKAVWDIHPLKEKEKYTCAKCHTPSDENLIKNLNKNKKAIPEESHYQKEENISCIYCHTINSIEEHETENINKNLSKNKYFYSADKKNRDIEKKSFGEKSSFFGLIKKKSGSPYHKIDYTNDNYYNGKMCMGCHSHRQNDLGTDLCRTGNDGVNDNENNCISCHMPKIKGSFSTIKDSKTHRYHGFKSNHNNQKLMEKYIKINIEKESDNFNIFIKNESTHELILHPLRVAQLRVNILRNSKIIKSKKITFKRVIGNDNGPSLPWEATKVIKNNMIKSNENKKIKIDFKLMPEDIVEIVFGYYKVAPKMVKKLGLENIQEATEFNILKSKYFNIK